MTLQSNPNIDEDLQNIRSYFDDELDIFQTYLEDLGYSNFTVTSYLSDVQSFLLFLYNKEKNFPTLEEITSKQIQEFLRKTQKGLAKTTRNRRLMALRTFYKSLVKAEILKGNPANEVDIAKTEKNSLPTYLSDEELQKLFQCIRRDQYHIRNKCILMLMSLAGLRVIEIQHLNVTDFIRDEEDPGIRVLGKGNKERYIPLPYSLYDLLLDYEKNYRPSPKPEHHNAFFLSKRGTRISRRRIQEIAEDTFQTLKSQPNMTYLQNKPLSSHKLRHTFGTRLVREGVDLVTVQELMGHSNLSTTQIYTHVNNKQKQEAMRNNNLSKFF